MVSGKSTASVVIIGGGVIGLSTAYHLARKGVKHVVVLEKDHVGAGSSHRAGGIITGLLWNKTGVEARKISLELYRELSVELADYGYQFQAVGCLNVFDARSWSERAKLLPLYDECAAPYEVIDADEMHYRWADLTPADDMIGLYDPLGGYSEPEYYLPALTQRCRDLGVDIRQQTPVYDFLLYNDRISGVITSTGAVEADVVVCTLHAWTLKLLAKQNIQLPMKAFVHQRYTTKPLSVPMHIPAVNANPQSAYFRPATGQRLLVGGETANRPEFVVPGLDFKMDALNAPSGLEDRLLQNITPMLPGLQTSTWDTKRVGLITFSMDGEPILGQMPGFKGLLVGAAFHSGGFAYNPVAGLLLAELIVDGQTQIDISAFSPDRFDSQASRDYLATIVDQRDAVARRH